MRKYYGVRGHFNTAGRGFVSARFLTKVVTPFLGLVVLWSESEVDLDAADHAQPRSLRSKVLRAARANRPRENESDEAIDDDDDDEESHDEMSGSLVYESWKSNCGPILDSGRDIFEYNESVPCWQSCHNFIAVRILESPIGNMQGRLQNMMPFTAPWPSSLNLVAGVLVWFVLVSLVVVLLRYLNDRLNYEVLPFALALLCLLIHCYLVIVTGLVSMSAFFLKDASDVVGEVAWAESWLPGILSLRLPYATMKVSIVIELVVFLRIVVRFGNKLFHWLAPWRKSEFLQIWALGVVAFFAGAYFLWVCQLFLMTAVFAFKSGSHGAFWVCAKSASASYFGWMPKETPYIAGLFYACFCFLHGILQPNEIVKVRKRPNPKRSKSCMSDRSWSHLSLFTKVFIIFVDVSLDIAQTMLFFCRGQPFFGVLNLFGLGIQAFILLYQMARGRADSNSLLAVVLQSDAVTHYMSSLNADMAISAFYGKSFREAFGETYLSLIIALTAVFTVPLKYVSDVILFVVSVTLSLSSVKSGVADALEFYQAEEESSKQTGIEMAHGHCDLRMSRIPANHYDMRIAYGKARYLRSIGVLRVAEALTCPVALLVLAGSSDMKVAVVFASLTCGFITMCTYKDDCIRVLQACKGNIKDLMEVGTCFGRLHLLGVFFYRLFLLAVLGVATAFLSSFGVMLLHANPLTTHAGAKSVFSKAVSFKNTIVTKCCFAAITWMTLIVSMFLPGVPFIDFGPFFWAIMNEAISNPTTATGVLSIVKLLLMGCGLLSVVTLVASSVALENQREQWGESDRAQAEVKCARLRTLRDTAHIIVDFFLKYQLLDKTIWDRRSGHLGVMRDPSGSMNIMHVVLRQIVGKVYGEEDRPGRITDRLDPNFDLLEAVLWEICKARDSPSYITPSSLSNDILLLVRCLPTNAPIIVVPAASAILRVGPLVRKLKAVQKAVDGMCLYEKPSELGLLEQEGEDLSDESEYTVLKNDDEEDSDDAEIWAMPLDKLLSYLGRFDQDSQWNDLELEFGYDTFMADLRELLADIVGAK